MRCILTILLLSTFLSKAAVITGIAPDQIGEKARLVIFDDYITKTTKVLGEGVVQADSTFSIDFDCNRTYEAVLEIGSVFGYLYIQPNSEYSILIPEDTINSVHASNVELIFENVPPEDDINFMIRDLDYRIDGFVGQTYHLFGSPEWVERMKNFKEHLAELFGDNTNEYFIPYMTFSIANLELIGHVKKDAQVNRELIYRNYIEDAPVFYQNNAYMNLINGFYKNVFKSIPPFDHRRIMNSIVLENTDSLIVVLGSHAYFKQHQLTELVMIKGLGEAYMMNTHPRTNILNMLTQISKDSRYKKHRHIAKNMISRLTKLKRGYPAPDFSLRSDMGDTLSLKSFKGNYVYLTFFESWSTEAIKELEIVRELNKKYGEHIKMVSVCFDPTFEEMEEFLKEHKDYNWTFLHADGSSQVKKYYDVVSYPEYVLIDPEGNIQQAPALRPTPNGNYESIHRTMHKIHNSLVVKDRLTPRDGHPDFQPRH